MDKKGLPEWVWKEDAIRQCAGVLRKALPEPWIAATTFVPVPPSVAKGDPMYDDRLVQVLRLLGTGLNTDVREMVVQPESMVSAHATAARPSIHQLIDNYALVEEEANKPLPERICIFDDVLTTGAYFRAMESVLRNRFPAPQIVGLFIARRVLPPADTVFPF